MGPIDCALSGLDILAGRGPRALPWAMVCRPFGAPDDRQLHAQCLVLRQAAIPGDRLPHPFLHADTGSPTVGCVSLPLADLDAIVAELRQFAEVDSETEQAIVCLVGENIRYTPGVAKRVFDSLNNINVRMISQGASEINLTFVIDENDVPGVVQRLHGAFFADLDPEVFA